MSETYVRRHLVKRGFERIPNEAGRELSPLALGILTEALTHGADDKRRMTADEIYKRWKPRLGSVAPSRAQIKAALSELEQAGYRHLVERRCGSAWVLAATWHNVPELDCDNKRCRTCRPSDLSEIGGSEGNAVTSGNVHKPSSSDVSISDPSEIGGSRTITTTEPSDQKTHTASRVSDTGSSLPDGLVRTTAKNAVVPTPMPVPQRDDLDDLTTAEQVTVNGMDSNGANPVVVANKIRADRRRPEVLRRLNAGETAGQVADDLGLTVDQIRRDLMRLFRHEADRIAGWTDDTVKKAHVTRQPADG